MSRPFSYNDENFTVIGNLLIIHVAFSGDIKESTAICSVPPEIIKRNKYNGITGSYYRNPFAAQFNIRLYVENGFLNVSTTGYYSNGEFFCYY